MSSKSGTDDKTRRCADCGTRSSPGHSFCDGCGAVLQWSPGTSPEDAEAASPGNGTVRTERSATNQVPVPAPDPVRTGAETVSTGYADRVGGQQSVTVSAPSSRATEGPGTGFTGASTEEGAGSDEITAQDHHTPGDEDDHAADVIDDAEWKEGKDGIQSEVASAVVPASTAEMAPTAERARALLVPVEEATAQVRSSVAPVLPGVPLLARPEVHGPLSDGEEAGGVPCPWCATANRPDRHFCRRCALRMAGERESPERRPWWRRLLDFRNKEAPWAGERPRLHGEFWHLVRWGCGAALAVGLVVLAAFGAAPATQAVQDHFAKRVPVIPDSYAASHSYPGHGPEKAFDRVGSTWWGPGFSEAGQGQWIEARFNQPVRLLDLLITPGVSSRPDQISQSALPRGIEALITTADGGTETRNLTLDEGGVQHRAFRADRVIAVRFVLRSAYGISTTKQVAIAEIEFFGPSIGS